MFTPQQRGLAEFLNSAINDESITVQHARAVAHMFLRDREPYLPPASLADAPRYNVDDDGCGWAEYGFMPEWVKTDADAEEWCDCQRMWVSVMWDCSGQTFTKWIDWHRNPNGRYSYKHVKAIDV